MTGIDVGASRRSYLAPRPPQEDARTSLLGRTKSGRRGDDDRAIPDALRACEQKSGKAGEESEQKTQRGKGSLVPT